MNHRQLLSYFLALALSVFGFASNVRCAETNSDARIVAVGDVHGAFDSFVQILLKAGVIDDRQKWAGGNITFIQTGDILDRGPKGRSAMDLLMSLEEQASANHGRVIPLLGNHEVMNIIGDLRYVPAEEYANYADSGSEQRREQAYQEYQDFEKYRSQAIGKADPSFTSETKSEWQKAHPLGFIEQREAFSPQGKYGRWLRKHSAVADVNNIIFLHGGISPNVSKIKISDINRMVSMDLQRFDEQKQYLVENKLILPFFTLEEMLSAAREEVDLIAAPNEEKAKNSYTVPNPKKHLEKLEDFLAVGSWLSVHPEGPLWFRGYSEWPDDDGEKSIAMVLDNYRAEHIVVGHTVQPNGSIRSRFHGKIFLIDTGMLASSFPGGRPSALEIQGGTFSAIYLDQRILLWKTAAASERK